MSCSIIVVEIAALCRWSAPSLRQALAAMGAGRAAAGCIRY